MPVLLVPLFVFMFTLGKATSEKVPVVYVDANGITREEKAFSPIMVIRDGDDVTVRSAIVNEPYTESQKPFRKDSFGDITVDCQTDCK